MSNVIWISWENHRRTDEICDYLSIKPYVIVSSRSSLIRYFYLIKETIKTISRSKPSTLIVQNPSIVLAAIAVMLQYVFRYQLIVDAHNEAIQPYTHDKGIIRFVARLLMRYSKYTIVTNKYLAEIVEDSGGQAIILPDRVPRIGQIAPIQLALDSFNIILIATYAADEPITQIIGAACALEDKVTLYVTGNFSRLENSYTESLPSNIVFTGFLSNENYWSYLNSANAIIDLSLKDNCLVCGAYEAVAVSTPLILSNNKASMEYFNKGALFTDNSAEDIKRVFLLSIKEHVQLVNEVTVLKQELTVGWQDKANVLTQKVRQVS
jgi:glycosyltransferase involved in cell wall biosynthesis